MTCEVAVFPAIVNSSNLPFLENDTNNVIEITFRDNTKKQYKLSQEGNTFRSYYCRSIENEI